MIRRLIYNRLAVLSGVAFFIHLPIVVNSYRLAHRLARECGLPDPELWGNWNGISTETNDQAFLLPRIEANMHFAESGLFVLAVTVAVGVPCLLLGRRRRDKANGSHNELMLPTS
jgi:hypothetical protein